jgi:hypothetical protein
MAFLLERYSAFAEEVVTRNRANIKSNYPFAVVCISSQSSLQGLGISRKSGSAPISIV